MTKSELINRLYLKGNNLLLEDVAATVHVVLESMQDALGRGERIEIRGLGAFSLRERKGRTGRNPRTGEAVEIPTCYKVHFRPGKELRERVIHSNH
jgi:integration host factor subunit beta